MNPGAIEHLIKAADKMEVDGVEPIGHFAVRWMAWEAMRLRALQIAARRAGWSMVDSRAVIRQAKLSSASQIEAAFRNLGCSQLSTMRGDSGRAWHVMAQMAAVRNRLFHAAHKYDMTYLAGCSELVARCLNNASAIFGGVKLTDSDCILRSVGNPLKRRPVSSSEPRASRPRAELVGLLISNHQRRTGMGGPKPLAPAELKRRLCTVFP